MTFALGRMWQKRTSRGIVTRRVDLRRRGAHLGRAGLRIVLVADIHARADWFPQPDVERLVDAVCAVDHVDFVAMVGDFTGDDPGALDGSVKQYQRIDVPIVATLGNHDHWAGAAHATRALVDGGIHLLTNRAVPLTQLIGERGGDTWLAGIDSCWTRKGGLPGAHAAAAFNEVPDDAEAIVLGHEPHLATMHEQALHLAGHTHCGQIRSPILGDWSARMHMPRFSEPFPCRLYEVPVDGPPTDELPANRRTANDRRWVYTTAGVGFSTIDMRGFCPPEIVVIDC